MTNLINDLFNYIPANSSIRDYKGYQQHRETLFELHFTKKISFRINTEWMFLVTDVCDQEGYTKNTCFVAKSDGSFELVAIDPKNRITVAGKKYFNWISYY